MCKQWKVEGNQSNLTVHKTTVTQRLMPVAAYNVSVMSRKWNMITNLKTQNKLYQQQVAAMCNVCRCVVCLCWLHWWFSDYQCVYLCVYVSMHAGRDCEGIHFAVNYLETWQKKHSGRTDVDDVSLSAKDKRVVVIGGGDTGVDCIATALRQVPTSVSVCIYSASSTHVCVHLNLGC